MSMVCFCEHVGQTVISQGKLNVSPVLGGFVHVGDGVTMYVV
jgi:hypothetical protein